MKKLVSLALVLMMVLSSLGNAGLRAYAAEEAPESSIAAEETAEKEVTEATASSENEEEAGQDLAASVESAGDADIEDTDVEDVDTEAVDDQDAGVEDTDVEDAAVEDADVEDADIEDADVEDTDVEDADVEDVDVEDADVEDADVEDADIEDADVEDAAPDKKAEADSETEETVVEISEDDSESESPSEDASAEQAAEEDKKVTEEEPKRAATKAASNGTTVLAFTSDVHNGTRSGNETNVSANRMDRWLSNVDPDHNISVMGFCGDMASAQSDSSSFWTYTKTVMDLVDSHGFDGVYAVGNHEYGNGSFATTSNSPEVRSKYRLNQEGRAVSGENYVIYCLGTNSSHGSSWAYDDSQITALSDYMNSVSNDKVIIILTHFPLHDYGMHRTGNTQPLLNAINTAAAGADGFYGNADDKKIVYLWGHNHSEGDNNYDQVWLPGDTLPNANSSKSNFYYAAAGSMADSEYGQSAKVLGKGLILTISEDNLLSFTYYDANGNNVTEPNNETISEEPKVPTPIEGVTITNTNTTVKVGRTLQLSYSTQPSNATVNSVTWSSSNTSVATVDNSGKVTGVSEGKATITLTVNDGLTKSVVTTSTEITVDTNTSEEVTVDITPESGNNSPEESIQIQVGDTLVINVTNGSSRSAYDFTATSANTGIAAIQGNATVNVAAGGTGQITVEGVAEGTVDITIQNNSSYGSQYARKGTIHLTVGDGSSTPVDPPSGDTVDITPTSSNSPEESIEIKVGETFIINVTNGSTSNAYDFTATSANTSIAAIQGNATVNIAAGATGQITVKGLAAGTANITIQNSGQYSTRKGTVRVTVVDDGTTPVDPPSGDTVSITPTTDNPEESIKIEVGDTLVINVTNGSTSSAYDFTATSADASIAAIQGNATVNIASEATGQFTIKGLTEGTVDITIQNSNTYGSQYTRKGTIHLTVGDGSSTPVDPPSGDTVNITPTTDSPEESIKIEVGETLVINVTNGSSSNAYDFTATSADTSVATIQGSATVNIAASAVGQFTVKGLVEGTVDITIQNSNTYGSQYIRKGIIHLTVGAGSGEDPIPSGEGDTPVSGKKYVILASDGYALTSEGETVGYSNGSGNQVYHYYGLSGEEYTIGENVAPDRLLWTFTASGAGYYIQDQNGKYLNGTYESNNEGGYTGTLKLDNTPDVWIISGVTSEGTVNANILKSTNASATASSEKYLTHGNGENGGDNTNIFTLRSEENATSTTFYEYNDDGTYVTDPDDPTPVDPPTDGYTIYITANQEKVAIGDTVTFTITLGPVDHLGSMQMDLVIPDGLSYVEDSFTITEGLISTLGYEDVDFTEKTMRFSGFSLRENYSSSTGTVLGTFKCIVNESFTGAASVTLTNLEFWDTEASVETTVYYKVENATVSLAGKFSVSFNMNGHGEAIDAQAVYEGDEAAEPAVPTADGYTFGGWYSDTALETEYNFNTPVTANIVLYAKWTADNYTIQFVNEDGTILQSSEVAYGATPSYTGTTPTKAATAEYAYTFERWEPAITTVTGNKTYTAVFNETARTYGDPEWTWTGSDEDGYTAAVATFTTNDGETEFTKSETDSSIDIQITDPTCTEAGQKVYTASVTFNGKSYNGSKTVEIAAIGHAWGEPTYEWAADNSTVTATRICAYDAAHKDTETAAVTSEVTKPATCEAKGETTYTAEFENEAFATQTLTVEDVEALGHNWKAPTYDWAEDNSTVTATRVCENDETHKQTETVATSSYTSQPASCEESGVHIYVAIFTQEGFEDQQKSVADIPALGHTWGEATYIWSDKYDSVYASHVCQVCEKSEIEVAPSTSEVTKAATCEDKGETTYTAVFTKDGFETQIKTVANIDAIGHDWDVPTYEWAADNSTVTASRVCKNDAAHIETETVETEYAVVTAATETAVGLGRYTSKEFKNEAFEIQTKDVTIQPTGFEVTYEWVKTENGGYQVNATAVPYAEGAETITETVEAAYSVTTEPTCEKTGVGTWTAEFTKDQFTVQTKDVEIAALGHDMTAHAAVEATCEENGNSAYWSCSRCGKYFSDSEGKTEIEENSWVIAATGHSYGTPSYEWTADYSKVTATRICANDAEHVETETVETTSEVTKAATCEEKGETTYTAEFENEAFETQTQVVEIEAIGHDWSAVSYTWAADNSKVTASRVCAHDETHIETETVDTTSEVTKAATCEQKGETTYTAEFENEAFETQTKTAANIDAIGHAWGEAAYEWADDYSSVTATRICANDADHVETEMVETASEVTKDATCEAKGETTYTAEFRNEAFETQTVTVENVDALGHDYAAVVTDPTCTEGGYTTYTCSRCGDSFVADETAALGHKWGEPDWTWADDFSTAEAKFVCGNDASHVENVEAEVTVEIKSGYVYTATVTGPDGESYSDEKKIEASNITSNTTSFDGKLFLNTYIVLSENVKADADAYVSVTFNDVTTKFSVADLLEDVDTQGRVRVRQEVFAAMMRDVMTLQLFNGQDEAQMLTYKETTDVTDGFQYSVLDYLKDRQENSSNPEMVELARAAELYGIASQVYFNYKTEQLTADDIQKMKAEAATITIPSTFAEELTGTLPAGISRRTKTVMFQSDNALRQNFYFADTDLWKYTFKLNGKTVAPTRRASGQYYVEQQNIASGLLSTVYTFTVTDGTNTFTIKSSALGYAYDRQENSTNQDMINLAKLLYLYSQAADAYFD